jgi:hypothetical protein
MLKIDPSFESNFRLGFGNKLIVHINLSARRYQPMAQRTDSEGIIATPYLTGSGKLFTYLHRDERIMIGKLVYHRQITVEEYDRFLASFQPQAEPIEEFELVPE